MSDSQPPQTDAVLRRAVQLQADRDEAAQEQQTQQAVAAEMGIEPATLQQAARDIDADGVRAEHAAAQQTARRKVLAIVGLTMAVAGIIAAVVAMQPAPPPWNDDFSAVPGQWVLTVNAGTRAALAFPAVASHGAVAALTVDRFAADDQGKYFANVTRAVRIELTDFRDVRFCMRGQGLTTVRLFLEAGELRWRSLPVVVTTDWMVHTMPLRAFELQRRSESGWQTIAFKQPHDIAALSFKSGHFINEKSASGSVQVDDLRFD